MNKIPVFKLKINQSDASAQMVEYIALVDQPAIELNWMEFSKHYEFTSDIERRLIMGPLMIADMPIFRHGIIPFTKEEGDYYVVFDKNTIYDVVLKFFRNGNESNFNLMHDSNKRIEGIYMIESFIVDATRGVMPPKAFEGINEGSWLVTVKIDNEEVWNDFVKTGRVKGFSVEGIFNPVYSNMEEEKLLNEIAEIVKGN